MIVSASYRTDIPTFYADWFRNRLRAGYCLVRNPYSGKPYRVSLRVEDVDGYIFWTRNLRPFTDNLTVLRDQNTPFLVSYTINNYPRALEYSVVDARRAVEDLHVLAGRTPGAGVWRYDPILFSSLTPPAFHRDNFAALAAQLRGAVDTVVVSMAQMYQKTRRNLTWAAKTYDFQWEDPDDVVKMALLGELRDIAVAEGLTFSLCAQRHLLSDGIADARCVDAERLTRNAGHDIAGVLKPHREKCGCYESRDIGDYDTCPHGCVYCYAVRNRDLAARRYKRHNPESAFLFE